MRYIGPDELARTLPMSAAVDALESAFGSSRPETPLRSHVDLGGGELLLMPSFGTEGAGVKLITINEANPGRGLPLIQGVYALFAPDSLTPQAVLDGAALTGIRTAAVSGLATRHLARPEAASLVIFGAGTQGRTHLEAMAAVRPISSVVVVSRGRERAEGLVRKAHGMGLQAEVGGPEAVGAADIVCTCTTSPEPVFDGTLVAAGAHVNAVGAFKPDDRELDEHLITRARVVVETKAAALEEAGDVIIPLRKGLIAEDSLVELSDVVSGRSPRWGADDVTVFKSVGVAFEDLVVARAAFELVAGSNRSPL
jgi:ornithine cyclodeaminase/alanine dehydrogenase-like protein (mu-crystallin family)